MKAVKYMTEEEVIKRGIDALYKELGPIEARRFLAIKRPPTQDSVTRHRKLQASLNRDQFFEEAMRAHRKQAKKG